MAGLETTKYVRLTAVDIAKVNELADREGLAFSDIVRRAVRLYLSGGAEKWAEIQASTAAVREVTPAEVAGGWFSRLSLSVRQTLYRLGQSLDSGKVRPDEVELPAWLSIEPNTSEDSDRQHKKGTRRSPHA
jgi:hypothetical protein